MSLKAVRPCITLPRVFSVPAETVVTVRMLVESSFRVFVGDGRK